MLLHFELMYSHINTIILSDIPSFYAIGEINWFFSEYNLLNLIIGLSNIVWKREINGNDTFKYGMHNRFKNLQCTIEFRNTTRKLKKLPATKGFHSSHILICFFSDLQYYVMRICKTTYSIFTYLQRVKDTCSMSLCCKIN